MTDAFKDVEAGQVVPDQLDCDTCFRDRHHLVSDAPQTSLREP